jgi:hypothetical protein
MVYGKPVTPEASGFNVGIDLASVAIDKSVSR